MRKFFILALILLVQFSILFYEADKDSATTDENVHLPAGYTYLKFHDFRFNPEHPPLQKMWVALPLLFQDIRLPADFGDIWQRAGEFNKDTWQEARDFGEKLLYASGNDADKMLLSGRLMTIMLTLLITILVYVWSQKLWGTGRAGLVSAWLVAFCPLMLAHGKLTNTEIGVTLFYLLSIWWLIKFLRSPGWKTALILGLWLGLLQLSKYTAIIFFPIAFFSLVYWLWLKGRQGWLVELKKILPGTGLALVIGWVIITLAYFPQIKFFYSPDYIKGLVLVLKHVASGHSSFLAGQFSKSGWWYYFPFAFLVKSSLVTLALIAGMKVIYLVAHQPFRRYQHQLASSNLPRLRSRLASSAKAGHQAGSPPRATLKLAGFTPNIIRFTPEHWIIIIAILVYLLSAMTSRADLGARHLLPIYPLIFVLLGWWGTNLKFKLKNFIVIILLLLFVADSLLVFPHHITYFNQLVGAKNGYKYLLDSNYDWGQEMKRVAKYQDEVLGGERVYLDYWWDGDLAPDYYDINYIKMLPSMTDISGTVIIGATSYMQPGYAWLRQYPIQDRIGDSVFVIKLTGSN